MPHSTPALNSILQASALQTLAFIVEHYSLNRAFAPVKDHWHAAQANVTQSLGVNATAPLSGVSGLDSNNTTLGGSALDNAEGSSDSLFSQLPKNLVAIVLVAVFRYWWLIYLERLLPARPRPRPQASAPSTSSEEKDDHAREEEVIRKYIAAGKVRPASLNWCNTALKWLLDLTLWNAFYCLLSMIVLGPVMQETGSRTLFSMNEFAAHFLVCLVGIAPIAALIGFILVPAHKRIVYEAGVELVWGVFIGCFLTALVPWLMKKEFVQQIIRNITESEMASQGNGTLLPQVGNRGDEL